MLKLKPQNKGRRKSADLSVGKCNLFSSLSSCAIASFACMKTTILSIKTPLCTEISRHGTITIHPFVLNLRAYYLYYELTM